MKEETISAAVSFGSSALTLGRREGGGAGAGQSQRAVAAVAREGDRERQRGHPQTHALVPWFGFAKSRGSRAEIHWHALPLVGSLRPGPPMGSGNKEGEFLC